LTFPLPNCHCYKRPSELERWSSPIELARQGSLEDQSLAMTQGRIRWTKRQKNLEAAEPSRTYQLARIRRWWASFAASKILANLFVMGLLQKLR